MPNDLAQVRRDLKEIKRARRIGLWLRVLGYATRPLVYLGPPTLLLLWAGAGLFSRPAAGLTIGDMFLIGGCTVGFFGLAVPGLLFVLNVDGGDIDWESWGRVGLWLLLSVVLAALLLVSL